MGWETDNQPMTREKAIKLKAHAYIMRFQDAGVPQKYCGNAISHAAKIVTSF